MGWGIGPAFNSNAEEKSMKSHNCKKARLAALLLAGAVWVPGVEAAVASGTSEGAGVQASASSLGIPLLDLNVPNVSGSAPAPYNLSDTFASVNAPLAALSLNTGVLTGSASSDVDGTAGSKTTSGTGTVNGTVLNLLGSVSLTASVLSSTSTITGDFGSLMANGNSIITNAVLTIDNGILLPDTVINLNANAAPNTVISNSALSALGIFVILNEQIESCSSFLCSLETNAIRIGLNPLGLQLVAADIKLGHSFASMTAPVPEASEWAMMLAGLGLVGFAARRRGLGMKTA
jgi:hypothetical protein